MDYQIRQELDRKADIWKVEELQRTIDHLKRENSDLSENLRRNQNSLQILHEALRQTLQVFTEASDIVKIDSFQIILNQL